MNFKELKNDAIAEFDYRRKYYRLTFNGQTPIVYAMDTWCLTMTVCLSMALNFGIGDVTPEDVATAGVMVVSAVMIASSVFNFTRWDALNSFLYLAESLAVWLGYLIASKIPIGDNEFGKLFYTTILCFVIGGGLGATTYILGRKLIDGRDKR